MDQRWRTILAVSFTTGLLLCVYLSTMSRELTWAHWGGDGGELITAAVTFGVPHPPGYPTYILLGWLWQWLPFASAAWKYHLFSAVPMATAGGILSAVIIGEGRGETALSGIGCGLIFGLAYIPWSQGIIAEVYGLNMLAVALFFACTISAAPALWRGITWGLAITTHLSSIFLLPLFFYQKNSRSEQWKLIPGLLIGLTPYLFLLFIGRSNAPIRWGDGNSLSSWWWLVTAKIYHPNSFGLPITSWIPRLRDWLPKLISSMTPLMWPLIIFSSYHRIFRERKGSHLATTEVKGVDKFILVIAGCYLIYAFFYLTPDALVLTLPAWFFLAYSMRSGMQRWPGLVVVLPLVLLLINYPLLNLRDERGVQPLVLTAFHNTPTTALLTTSGDPTIFSLWYLQHVEGLRPDLVLVDYHLFAFDWYRDLLQKNYPRLALPPDDNWEGFVELNRKIRPFCTLNITYAHRGYELFHSCKEP